MEPSDLNPSDSADREVEAWLRQPAVPLPANEFTQRVLAALPRRLPKVKAPSLTRPSLILIGAVAGTVLAAAQIESLSAVQGDWTAIAVHLEQAAAALADPRALAAMAVAGVSALYALLSPAREP